MSTLCTVRRFWSGNIAQMAQPALLPGQSDLSLSEGRSGRVDPTASPWSHCCQSQKWCHQGGRSRSRPMRHGLHHIKMLPSAVCLLRCPEWYDLQTCHAVCLSCIMPKLCTPAEVVLAYKPRCSTCLSLSHWLQRHVCTPACFKRGLA